MIDWLARLPIIIRISSCRATPLLLRLLLITFLLLFLPQKYLTQVTAGLLALYLSPPLLLLRVLPSLLLIDVRHGGLPPELVGLLPLLGQLLLALRRVLVDAGAGQVKMQNGGLPSIQALI